MIMIVIVIVGCGGSCGTVGICKRLETGYAGSETLVDAKDDDGSNRNNKNNDTCALEHGLRIGPNDFLCFALEVLGEVFNALACTGKEVRLV